MQQGSEQRPGRPAGRAFGKGIVFVAAQMSGDVEIALGVNAGGFSIVSTPIDDVAGRSPCR